MIGIQTKKKENSAFVTLLMVEIFQLVVNGWGAKGEKELKREKQSS